MALDSVKVPPELAPLFEKAQEYVRAYHASRKSDPSRGTIELHGQRYLQVRASSMSVEFFDMVKRLYIDDAEAERVARGLLFDVAHAIGLADAADFHEQMGLTDPVECLSAGPIHFAYSGWAFVDIDACSLPSPDDDYMLVYDHPYSFEADAWLRAERLSSTPVCVMNAGYSSGWCEASFGMPLVAAELTCRAAGHEHCHFVMAPPGRIRERIEQHLAERPDLVVDVDSVSIPGFFSERREAALALKASEARFRSMFENSSFAIALLDLEGTFLEMNEAGSRMMGIPREAAAGISFLDIVPEEVREVDLAHWQQTIDNPLVPHTFETAAFRGDGKLLKLRITESVIFDEHGAPERVVAYAHDLTQQHDAEEQLHRREEELQRARRLEALGRLAGGMAHDFNNLLTVIMGYAEQLEGQLDGHRGQAQAARIVSAAERASDLTSKLLAISRRQVLQTEVIDIPRLIDGLTDMLRRVTRDDVELDLSLPTRLWRVHADRSQLEQALVNLALNASDAMPRGGQLHMEFSNARLDPAEASEHGVDPGRFVHVAVRDNGDGMTDEALEHVFEPFFTTKSGGLGLGTASVYGFVQQSGGAITVSSSLGRGTTFRLWLPAASKAAPADKPVERAEPPKPVEGEIILLVDDNDDIRSLLEEQLDALGYEVLVADSGPAAMALSSSADRIDLLITDVVMPGMTGPEVASSVRQGHPALRVMFMTGYADGDMEAMPERSLVMHKPFSLVDLAKRIRRLLDEE